MPITKASRNAAGMTGAAAVLVVAEIVARVVTGRNHSVGHAAMAENLAAAAGIADLVMAAVRDKDEEARKGARTIAPSDRRSLRARGRRE